MDIYIFKDFKNLKNLDISGNPISNEYAVKLKEYIPNCNINCFYLKYADENSSEITDLNWQGCAELWHGNTDNNIYTAKFEIFDGVDTKIITSNKPSYRININTCTTSGDITIKVYNTNKTLFKKDNPVNENVIVSKENAKNLKVDIIGKKAKGNLKIQVN
ncbi:hypothetical protein [Clostridium scatologenes]|uniref:Surface-layer protein n=1 Tax=Clostridium scatologenes TaxID=1548 RepID=A0A0E3JNV1_CLOSL|nr:hypothetical protein [Clostridium scatologenes]AKA69673.1 surface-layer protein [Clostridium scatologenes]